MRKTIVIITILTFVFSAFTQSQIDRELQLARKYIVLQRYDQARDILEALYMENPQNNRVLTSLKEVYFGLGENETLLDLLNNQASREPNNAKVRVDLGKVALIMGNTDDAMEYFDKAFKLYPKNEDYYQRAFRELLQRGYLEETREVIKTARKNIGKENLFALDMAMTYELESNFDRAMQEYGKYIYEHPDRFTTVERRIDIAGRTDDELQALEKSIRKMFDKGSLSESRIYRLLSRLNIRLENYDRALENLISASKNTKEDRKGHLVYPFAMQMYQQGNFETAIEAGEYIRDSKGPYADRGELIMAQAKIAIGDEDKGYEILQKLTDSKIREVALDAKLNLASMDLQNDDFEAAMNRLDDVLRSRNQKFMGEALQLYADGYIRNGKYDDAMQILDKHSLEFEKSPWFKFLVGEIKLFKGEYDEAEEIFQDLASKSPDDAAVNDAINYMMLLSSKDASDFNKLVDAIRLWKTERTVLAIEKLENAKADSEIKDEINWYLGAMALEENDLEKAEDAFKSIADNSPGSFYAPLALENLGDIAMEQNQTEAAYSYYQKVLSDYDDAINIVSVREKARQSGGI
ncbi:MAG: tetratricopeptide repeat protein [Candidatus Zixiibacteriota bacterium]